MDSLKALDLRIIVIVVAVVAIGWMVNAQLIDNGLANRLIDLLLGGLGGAALVAKGKAAPA